MKKFIGFQRLFKGVNQTLLAISFARFRNASGNSMILIRLPIYIASTPSPNLSWQKTLRQKMSRVAR
ncbi:MAG: hypothetical protein R6U51_02060 [Anaerolineales bacterium]